MWGSFRGAAPDERVGVKGVARRSRFASRTTGRITENMEPVDVLNEPSATLGDPELSFRTDSSRGGGDS